MKRREKKEEKRIKEKVVYMKIKEEMQDSVATDEIKEKVL